MSITKKIILIVLAILITIAVLLGYQLINKNVDSGYNRFVDFTNKDCHLVLISGSDFCLWIADDEDEQTQGLSNIYLGEFPGLQKADGMLFVFNDSDIKYFWMKDMLFGLDVLWIENGIVKKISEGVRAPDTSDEEPVRMSSDPYKVDMVIELPAGSVNTHKIELSDAVIFD